jgi:hypothetical protein
MYNATIRIATNVLFTYTHYWHSMYILPQLDHTRTMYVDVILFKGFGFVTLYRQKKLYERTGDVEKSLTSFPFKQMFFKTHTQRLVSHLTFECRRISLLFLNCLSL